MLIYNTHSQCDPKKWPTTATTHTTTTHTTATQNILFFFYFMVFFLVFLHVELFAFWLVLAFGRLSINNFCSFFFIVSPLNIWKNVEQRGMMVNEGGRGAKGVGGPTIFIDWVSGVKWNEKWPEMISLYCQGSLPRQMTIAIGIRLSSIELWSSVIKNISLRYTTIDSCNTYKLSLIVFRWFHFNTLQKDDSCIYFFWFPRLNLFDIYTTAKLSIVRIYLDRL